MTYSHWMIKRGETKEVVHIIELGDHQLIRRQAAQRVHFAHQPEITRMINELLASGVITRVINSPDKPHCTFHKKITHRYLILCVDYRHLNAITK